MSANVMDTLTTDLTCMYKMLALTGACYTSNIQFILAAE